MKLGNVEGDINGLWQVAHDSGELTSAVTSYDITGLEGDTDIEYKLICRFIDDTTVGDYKLTFNTDTGNNYGYQDIKGIDATASAVRDTSEAYWHIGQTSTDDYICFSETSIFSKSGVVRTGISTYAYDITGTTVTGIIKRGHSWNNTADEITQMVITAGADNINIGSRIILLKKVHNDGMKTGTLTPNKIEGAWERIYSNTLTSSASSTTISGLTGNTDVLYKLIVRGIDDTTVGVWKLLLNNDSTNIYGSQVLSGINSTVAASRATPSCAIIGNTATDDDITMSETLIYAKSGFERTMLTSMSASIATTTVTGQYLYGQVYNDTSTEITSMVITPTADNMNICTSVELYRLNL